MPQLRKYSLLTGDDLLVGPEVEEMDKILELGDYLATSRPDIVVHVEPPPSLQKWETVDAEG